MWEKCSTMSAWIIPAQMLSWKEVHRIRALSHDGCDHRARNIRANKRRTRKYTCSLHRRRAIFIRRFVDFNDDSCGCVGVDICVPEDFKNVYHVSAPGA